MSKLIQRLNEYDNILLIGHFPPPLGGVSVHIYRLSKYLTNPTVFDTSAAKGFKVLQYFRLCYNLISAKFRVIHVHHLDPRLLAILYALRSMRKFTIIATVHNPRLFESANYWERVIFSKFFSKVDTLVAVSDPIIQDFLERKIALPSDIIIEPAYLPPPAEDEDPIVRTYPEELLRFMASHTPIVSANAYALVFHQGIDLYGFDACIDLTHRLRAEFPSIGFLFALADDKQNNKYLRQMKDKIAELGLGDNFFIMSGQKELWPLLKRVDLAIRPTASDGDAVSIREALFLGTPAVASDVASRPEGTTLYRFGDAHDLYLKVNGHLNREIL